MIKIAINGAESTGKSVLTEQLAAHFHTVWEPELARQYVENNNYQYTYKDVCNIVRLQIEQQKKYEKQNSYPFVFFDTDLIITKVWFQYKYKQVPEKLIKRLEKRFFDFYLLCKPDLPWIDDPVREHGNDRVFFFNWYKKEIEMLNTPYAIIGGIGEERLQNAIQAIKIFETTKPIILK